MASRTRWTWVWVNSGRWWWTGRPGVLRFMGSQRVRHDWATELKWTELNQIFISSSCVFPILFHEPIPCYKYLNIRKKTDKHVNRNSQWHLLSLTSWDCLYIQSIVFPWLDNVCFQHEIRERRSDWRPSWEEGASGRAGRASVSSGSRVCFPCLCGHF